MNFISRAVLCKAVINVRAATIHQNTETIFALSNILPLRATIRQTDVQILLRLKQAVQRLICTVMRESGLRDTIAQDGVLRLHLFLPRQAKILFSAQICFVCTVFIIPHTAVCGNGLRRIFIFACLIGNMQKPGTGIMKDFLIC